MTNQFMNQAIDQLDILIKSGRKVKTRAKHIKRLLLLAHFQDLEIDKKKDMMILELDRKIRSRRRR